jgi:hypothetical protein
MDEARYQFLMSDGDDQLSEEEIAAGWHFCWDWDGLLIGPGMGELEFCLCKSIDQPLKLAAAKMNAENMTNQSADAPF